jgi:hypothetical protein
MIGVVGTIGPMSRGRRDVSETIGGETGTAIVGAGGVTIIGGAKIGVGGAIGICRARSFGLRLGVGCGCG